MLKFLVMKYIQDSANIEAVVDLLKPLKETDIAFPGSGETIEEIKNRLRRLGELEILKELEKGTFALYP